METIVILVLGCCGILAVLVVGIVGILSVLNLAWEVAMNRDLEGSGHVPEKKDAQ